MSYVKVLVGGRGYGFWRDHRKAEKVKSSVHSDNFWFSELLSGRCERITSGPVFISNSLGWIRVPFIVGGGMN